MTSVVDGIVADAQGDLEKVLGSLVENAEDLRAPVESTLRLAAEVYAARLAGADVRIAEGALKAAVLNLQAASSVVVAHAILGALQQALRRAAQATIAVAVAAL